VKPSGSLGLIVVIGVLFLHSGFVLAQTPSPAPTARPLQVPPPQPPLPALPPPVIPPSVRPSARSDAAAEIQRLTPRLQIWRPTGLLPQVPQRRGRLLDHAYVTGTEPATLRLLFDRRAAGEHVVVMPAKGLILNPPDAVLTVSTNGECTVSAQLADGVGQSHVIFYCQGVKTVLAMSRASLAKIEAIEAATGGHP